MYAAHETVCNALIVCAIFFFTVCVSRQVFSGRTIQKHYAAFHQHTHCIFLATGHPIRIMFVLDALKNAVKKAAKTEGDVHIKPGTVSFTRFSEIDDIIESLRNVDDIGKSENR